MSGVGKSDVFIASPIDLEGHRGRDWRYYAVDFSRMMPPFWAESRRSYDQFWSLYSLMRSEFVAQNSRPLNVDAFSRFAPSVTAEDMDALREDQQDIKNASAILVTEHVCRVANELLVYWRLTLRFSGSFPLTQWLQSHGINARFLGLLYRRIAQADNCDPECLKWFFVMRRVSAVRNIDQVRASLTT